MKTTSTKWTATGALPRCVPALSLARRCSRFGILLPSQRGKQTNKQGKGARHQRWVLLAQVSVPDVFPAAWSPPPGQAPAPSPPLRRLSFTHGDFGALYRSAAFESHFDVCVTNFFIDCAENVSKAGTSRIQTTRASRTLRRRRPLHCAPPVHSISPSSCHADPSHSTQARPLDSARDSSCVLHRSAGHRAGGDASSLPPARRRVGEPWPAAVAQPDGARPLLRRTRRGRCIAPLRALLASFAHCLLADAIGCREISQCSSIFSIQNLRASLL